MAVTVNSLSLYKTAFNHLNQRVIVQNNDDLKVLVEWGVLNVLKAKLFRGSGVELANFTNLDETKGKPMVCFASRFCATKVFMNLFQQQDYLIKEE